MSLLLCLRPRIDRLGMTNMSLESQTLTGNVGVFFWQDANVDASWHCLELDIFRGEESGPSNVFRFLSDGGLPRLAGLIIAWEGLRQV